MSAYHEHSQRLLDAVYRLEFADVGISLADFWQGEDAGANPELLSDPYMIAHICDSDMITHEVSTGEGC